eukprot:3456263-Pyramimonas_sp.AAC.1
MGSRDPAPPARIDRRSRRTRTHTHTHAQARLRRQTSREPFLPSWGAIIDSGRGRAAVRSAPNSDQVGRAFLRQTRFWRRGSLEVWGLIVTGPILGQAVSLPLLRVRRRGGGWPRV